MACSSRLGRRRTRAAPTRSSARCTSRAATPTPRLCSSASATACSTVSTSLDVWVSAAAGTAAAMANATASLRATTRFAPVFIRFPLLRASSGPQRRGRPPRGSPAPSVLDEQGPLQPRIDRLREPLESRDVQLREGVSLESGELDALGLELVERAPRARGEPAAERLVGGQPP